jgi:hypothetical protein
LISIRRVGICFGLSSTHIAHATPTGTGLTAGGLTVYAMAPECGRGDQNAESLWKRHTTADAFLRYPGVTDTDQCRAVPPVRGAGPRVRSYVLRVNTQDPTENCALPLPLWACGACCGAVEPRRAPCAWPRAMESRRSAGECVTGLCVGAGYG